ncbi:MAG: DUF2065 domain-containing protein [Gammaproteobacteria bacterium]|jgi:uncharacterized protein YjeT (DUF2065 family)
MWHDFLLALSLVLVVEGLLPFLNPAGFRQAMQLISQMDDRQLRIGGFASMIVGVLLMYFVNR